MLSVWFKKLKVIRWGKEWWLRQGWCGWVIVSRGCMERSNKRGLREWQTGSNEGERFEVWMIC